MSGYRTNFVGAPDFEDNTVTPFGRPGEPVVGCARTYDSDDCRRCCTAHCCRCRDARLGSGSSALLSLTGCCWSRQRCSALVSELGDALGSRKPGFGTSGRESGCRGWGHGAGSTPPGALGSSCGCASSLGCRTRSHGQRSTPNRFQSSAPWPRSEPHQPVSEQWVVQHEGSNP